MSDREFLVDNDGYYQDVDEFRANYGLDDNDSEEEREYKPRRLNAIPERYTHIKNESWTKKGRRHFCEERNKIHAEARRQYEYDVVNNTYVNLPDSQVFCQCKNCGGGFVAKKADRKRGWAKFCSKSCKAQSH